MKTNKIFANQYVKGALLVMAGLLLGWLFFYSSSPSTENSIVKTEEHSNDKATIWTCAMHPQIKMDKKGLCPICGMDLIPLKNSNTEIDENAIEISESAMKLAEIQTSIVSYGSISKDVSLYGKIQVNEKRIKSQSAHVSGRIEQLLINVTGETVKKGQLIARIYSPELVSAQKELLEAKAMGEKYPALLEAAREKLRNLKLPERQIQQIETSGSLTTTFDIYSNASGIVNARKVNEGDYISKGTVIYEIADLSGVWAVLDAYESDLPWISIGQGVEFTAQAIPGKTYKGTISFIDPIIDPLSRVARARIEINNSEMALKPEMFVNAIIKSKKQSGQKQLIIPQSSVLWTGKRSIVYVKLPDTEHPTFKLREIGLGNSMNGFYVVLDGLSEGEEIVTNGTFSVDAAAQLAGKVSMMNPEGEKASTGHNHGNENNTATNNNHEKPKANPNSSPAHTPGMQMEHAEFTVAGNCEMCKERIEKAAKSITGVATAEWNIKTKKLHTSFDKSKTSIMNIQKAIARVGHDTEKFKAPDDVYSKLPECCLYDRL
ncbi:MAG: efflux RND transporter periplasmic adaptor subunit [Bacteroidales bacterium]|nr:efflux RND transporter periplasmic adaptor subunit [Bacteroidales bacterium]